MKKRSVSPWALCTVVIAALLSSSTCDAGELTGSTTVVDPYLACVRLLAFDTQIADTTKKLPLYDMSAISFSMLADSSLPSPQERKEISVWFNKWERCWKDSEPLHQSQWPPDIFQLFQEENAEIHNIGIDLYNRNISFGEANKRVQDYGVRFRERVVAVVKQYQAEIAAQKAAAEQWAEQLAQRKQEAADRSASAQQEYESAQERTADEARQQRAQLIGNFLHQMAQQMRDLADTREKLAPHPTHTNCYTNVGGIGCTTQ
jgi:hypothetical protein